MIKKSSNVGLFLLLVLFFSGCKTTVDNSITFNNLSAGDIIVTFRGGAIKISSNQLTEIKEIPKGTYSYSTTFALPAGASSSSTKGDVTGTVVIKAGTKFLVLYTSTLIGGVYTLYATLSSSDDQTAITAP